MSQFYDRMASTALRLIEQFGQTITLRDETPGGYDPTTGVTTDPVLRDQTVQAVVLPASKGTVEAFDNRFIDGTLIESNLRALKIAAEGLAWAPKPGCVAVFGGEVWTLLGVTSSAPDGTALVYSATVRR